MKRSMHAVLSGGSEPLEESAEVAIVGAERFSASPERAEPSGIRSRARGAGTGRPRGLRRAGAHRASGPTCVGSFVRISFEMRAASGLCVSTGPALAFWHVVAPPKVHITRALPNIMNIVINPTVEDGSIRAAAILQTQDDLHRALTMRSSQLDDVARLTLVQTSVGVRTLGALVDGAVEYDDASARLASLIEQSSQCGLLTVSEGLRVAWLCRSKGQLPSDARHRI